MSDQPIAVVTGASRGVGKGIALALGQAGATVYVTGRTLEEGSAPLPGSIGATAEEVTERGGRVPSIQRVKHFVFGYRLSKLNRCLYADDRCTGIMRQVQCPAKGAAPIDSPRQWCRESW